MVREETLRVIDTIPDTRSVADHLRAALAPFGEKVLYAFLFGSYARGDADRWSDVDVGIAAVSQACEEERMRIRFALTEALAPLEVQVAYLDRDLAPDVFLAAVAGVPLVMNDEDACFERRMWHIHRKEEMRLVGLSAED